MADVVVSERKWEDVSRSQKGPGELYLRRITAEHKKITKLEVYIKNFDGSFPASPTITKIPSNYGHTTYFDENFVFELTGKKPVHYIRTIWYGDSGDSYSNYVKNVNIGFDARRTR